MHPRGRVPGAIARHAAKSAIWREPSSSTPAGWACSTGNSCMLAASSCTRRSSECSWSSASTACAEGSRKPQSASELTGEPGCIVTSAAAAKDDDASRSVAIAQWITKEQRGKQPRVKQDFFSHTVLTDKSVQLEPKCPVGILVQHSTHMSCNRKLNASVNYLIISIFRAIPFLVQV